MVEDNKLYYIIVTVYAIGSLTNKNLSVSILLSYIGKNYFNSLSVLFSIFDNYTPTSDFPLFDRSIK